MLVDRAFQRIAVIRGPLPIDTARSKAALSSLIHRALFGIEEDVK